MTEQVQKMYIHHVQNSGFIDKLGKRHVFQPYGKIGRIITSDPDLIKELDDTIKAGGSQIRELLPVTEPEAITGVSVPAQKLSAIEAAKANLEAIKGL